MLSLGPAKRLAFVCLGLLSAGAWADEYSVEIAGELGRSDGPVDTNRVAGSAHLYLSPVLTGNHPHAEAAFLQRATNIFVYLGLHDQENSDSKSMGAGGEFYFPTSIFYLAGSLNQTETDGNESNSWSVTGGLTPLEGLRLTTTYSEDNGYDPNISAKYVRPLAGEQALGLQAGFYDDDVNTYNAGFDFYLNRSTSAGAAMEDSGAETSYTLRGRHFFSPSFYVDAQYTNAESADEVHVKAGLRF